MSSPSVQDVTAVGKAPDAAPWSVGRTTAWVALGTDLATLGLVLAGVHSPWRMGFGVAFGLLVPGAATVLPLRIERGEMEVALSLAVSLASTICLAQLMLWLHLWHPIGLVIAIGIAALPLLLHRAVRG